MNKNCSDWWSTFRLLFSRNRSATAPLSTAACKTTGGRYHLNSHNLDFNPLVLEMHGLEELEKVVKHELCHYHLHLEGRGYQHRDADFRHLLKESGGSRFVKDLRQTGNLTPPKWLYGCSACGQMYPRKRRIDLNKYICGKCKGKCAKLEL